MAQPVTTASVRPNLLSWSMSSTTGACQVCGGGGVVEFPNNTESQGGQAFASLLGTRMVNGMGHYWTHPSLGPYQPFGGVRV